MALTVTEISMNADLFRLAYPKWPSPPRRSQAPAPDEEDRCQSCASFPGDEGGCGNGCVPQGTDSYFAELCTKGLPR